MARRAKPPKAAQAAAKKALGWRDKHGRDEVKGATRVGWTRANQLAKGGELTEETVRRMKRTLPNLKVITILGATHMVPQDKPEEFERHLRAYLEELSNN